jgi:CRISPR-associated endonuclease/helicase Cas3
MMREGKLEASEPELLARFCQEFAALHGGNAPFPWQECLFQKFCSGEWPSALDLPTGLGKTSVMAIWYLALRAGVPVPRRLVYVVDRRAVVDQATTVAETIKTNAADGNLQVSTLRGQYIDNRAWLSDPSAPAIIVGTVDMIGSRLLFSGYGVSQWMRPYHAGLLGADTLVVVDEAHLVPPFEELVSAIAHDPKDEFRPRLAELRDMVPHLQLMSLSATGRETENGAGKVFQLTRDDYEHRVVKQRLRAQKWLKIDGVGADKKVFELLAERAWDVGTSPGPSRVVVYCNSRQDALKIKTHIDKRAKEDKIKCACELIVGERRVRERELLFNWLKRNGFIGETWTPSKLPTFVVATSAGEVGIDLDADHMICDLVEWERMVQRLGRVNRRGGEGRAAIVDVIIDVKQHEKVKKECEQAKGEYGKADDNYKIGKETFESAKEKYKKSDSAYKNAKSKWENAYANLQKARVALDKAQMDYERIESHKQVLLALPSADERHDASPGAIAALKSRDDLRSVILRAQTPAPLRPALTRALVDAWSMTSLDGHSGRPDIQPWLRGWEPDGRPQTEIIWRGHLPVRLDGSNPPKREINDFFEAAAPHRSEVLEAETWRVVDWLIARATARVSRMTQTKNDVRDKVPPATTAAMVLGRGGKFERAWTFGQLASLRNKDNKSEKEILSETLVGHTLVASAQLRGLNEDGMLDDEADHDEPLTIEAGTEWMKPDGRGRPAVRFRVRSVGAAEAAAGSAAGWREEFRFALDYDEDGEAANWLLVEQWLGDSDMEDGRALGANNQTLSDHRDKARYWAREIATRLRLPDRYVDMLAMAARLHDEGKQASIWQRAFNAPRDGAVYAKTKGPLNLKLLAGYRHEFGSLAAVERDADFNALSDDLKELALHVVAGHHGRARPLISTEGCEDAPPSLLEGRARDVALRFARLQNRWGPWGLAWWEALLRAADQNASRDNGADVDQPDKSAKVEETV